MAGRIPQEFINDLVDRADIVEIVSNRTQIKKAGREYKGCCPFHGEKTPSFTVSAEKGFYHCFGCGAHGTALGFLMEFDRLEFIEAVEELATIVGVEVPRESGGNAANTSPAAPLFELLQKASKLFRQQLKDNKNALEYIKARGLDNETAARFQIGYAPPGWDYLFRILGPEEVQRQQLLKAGLLIRNEEGRVYDRFRDRIMFPIRDGRGRVVGFGGRVMGNDEPKYLNSPETPVFHKGRELYGLYEARQANRKLTRLLVVEGYMDVVALARHGITTAVATLGTATTREHLQRLFRATKEIVFCFDGDRAGRDAAWRALQNTLPELREGRQVRFLFLADGEDPDSVVTDHGAEEFNRRLEQSQPLSEYLIEHLQAETDLQSIDGQAKLAELARPLFNQIPQGIYRELLLGRLAEDIGLNAARLEALLADSDTGYYPDSSQEYYGSEPTPSPALPTSVGRSSLVRKAVTLVLHHPAISKRVNIPPNLEELERPGITLLTDLLFAAQEKPDIKPARLAADFADHVDGGSSLQRLLTNAVPLEPNSDWTSELQDTLKALVQEDLEQRFTTLTQKANNGLSTIEKQEFRELQKQLAGNRGRPK